MHPVLFSIGPVAVYSYGVLLAAAFAACWAVARWYLVSRRAPAELALDLVLAAAVGGIVGARALYVITEWSTYAAHPLWIFQLQRGGMVFYGGLIGGIVAVAVFVRLRRLPLALVADVAGLTVPLGSAIGRLGCFLNGCCAGVPTDAWFGVTFPGTTGPVVPSQLLDAGLNAAIFTALLLVAVRRRPRTGTLWWTFLTLYPVSRFLVETVRVNPDVAFGLSQAQLISIPLLVAGVAGLIRSLAASRRDHEAGARS